MLVASASGAPAQALMPPPRGSIFATSTARDNRDRLDVTAALSEALDSEAPPELRSRIQQGSPQSGGFSSMLTAAADYERNRRRGDVTAQLFTALQYSPKLGRVVALTHSAGAAATLRFSGRSSLELAQTADYSPAFLYRLFPTVAEPNAGDVAPPAPDYRVDESKSFSNSSLVTFRAGSARGTQLSATAEHLAAQFQGGIERPDLDAVAGRIRLAHGTSRTGSLSAEYEYRAGEFGYGAQATEQRLRIGVGYSPALSTSRRAQFRFNLAPSVVEIPATAVNISRTGTLFKMEGDARAEYPFLRSWSIGGTYRRGVEYISGFRSPVFRDATRIELSGLARERVDIAASAGYVVGQSILQRDAQHFDTYTGTMRGRYSVTRSFALYAEYLYYYYNLHGQEALAPDLPSVFEQHGLRVGLMLWARPVGR